MKEDFSEHFSRLNGGEKHHGIVSAERANEPNKKATIHVFLFEEKT